jgi:hypothetical protein
MFFPNQSTVIQFQGCTVPVRNSVQEKIGKVKYSCQLSFYNEEEELISQELKVSIPLKEG